MLKKERERGGNIKTSGETVSAKSSSEHRDQPKNVEKRVSHHNLRSNLGESLENRSQTAPEARHFYVNDVIGCAGGQLEGGGSG